MSLKKQKPKQKSSSILPEILILLVVVSVIAGYFLFRKELKVNKLDVNAVILDSGDVNVTESFLYKFKGSYNGVFREYKLIDCDDYVINSVVVTDKSGKEIVAEYSESGMPNTFDIEYKPSSTNIKLYSPSKNESKTVTINYTIKGAVKRYNDCGFLYWNFYDVPENSVVKEGTLKVSLNNAKFDENSFYYRLYGDGKIEHYKNENEILVSFEELSSLIGIKLKFQESFLNDDVKSNGYNYKESNYNYNKSNDSTTIVGIAISFAIIVGITIITKAIMNYNERAFEKKLKKYRSNLKEIEPKNKKKENRFAPSNLEPAFVNLLYNNGKEDKNVIVDSLLYLVSKGYYNVVDNGSLSPNKDMVIIYTGKDLSDEKSHLVFLLKWFNDYGTKEGINITNIHKRFEKNLYARKYISKKKEFESLVKKDALKEGILAKINGRVVISNEYYYEKDDWMLYRQYILKDIHAIRHLPGKDIDDVLIYSLSLEIENNQYSSIINSVSNIVDNVEEFERAISTLSRKIFLIQSINNLKQTTEKAIIEYNKYMDSIADSGSVGSGGSFSGGGGGSSGGF